MHPLCSFDKSNVRVHNGGTGGNMRVQVLRTPSVFINLGPQNSNKRFYARPLVQPLRVPPKYIPPDKKFCAFCAF